ncbi:Carbohydrate esterase family 4 protein [Mycena indigotica]|uniref:Carbohydrate esterase family 4 protein n=1 Tax=Mycena indigotica TaxID=2126181 RepID=A0A8H6WBI4_9AGAR|nr:Carbohydrate esterase family 4 protein [Mycena indigotica]KAF7311852.1 Carbohydrate esterase family 4 protein [Mycena indigotica]
MLLSAFLALTFSLLATAGDDGGLTGPTSSTEAAGYSCDPAKCKLPKCNCASTSPPGGLDPKDVPMFVIFTADDAVQSYTLDAVNQFLAQRSNPNGCRPKMTYFTSLNYTNYTLVTDWYVAGNEIADHTMTHVGDPSEAEINGNLVALNSLAGIPYTAIQGFRAPYLNYSVDTLKLLAKAGFTYDSSASASIPVVEKGTDAFWPYTLDNGMANDCLQVQGSCKGQPVLPGFWEIPMYAFFDNKGPAGPHLMDPWLDFANGASKINDSATLEYMKNTFTAHYDRNRQPIGLYPAAAIVIRNLAESDQKQRKEVFLSLTTVSAPRYRGAAIASVSLIALPVATTARAVVTTAATCFHHSLPFPWLVTKCVVWIVSNEQLLAWVQNPVPVSQLDSVPALKCAASKIDPGAKICSGIPGNEAGLLSHCEFPDFPFYTCYGCPQIMPTPDNPNPPQRVPDGQPARQRVPANCSTPFWDPIAGKCTCSAADCRFSDISRPIGPNGANLTGGGAGGSPGTATGSSPTPSFVPFNGNSGSRSLRPALWAAPFAIMVLIGATYGVFQVV